MEKLLFVADDNADHHFLLYKALRQLPEPHRVCFFEDGKNLSQQLMLRHQSNQLLPSLIILDLNMPGMNGLQLLRELKQPSGSAPALFNLIPIVIMSSDATPLKIQKCYQAGANAFIKKPVGFEKMQTTVKCLCEFWLELTEPAFSVF